MRLRDGSESGDPRLDRLPQFDERSRSFQVAERLAASPEGWRTHWNPAPGLDQGREGACVAFSGAHRINGSPIRRRPPLSPDFARQVYREAQARDPWPETREGGEEGTSVLAGALVLRDHGYIDGFDWIGAGSGDVGGDMVRTLHTLGGINFGIGWTNTMFHPRPSGLLEVGGGPFVGGHAIYGFEHAYRGTVRGEGKMDVVWLQQSWGPEHGVTRRGIPGCVAIRTEELVNRLLEAPGQWRGEGCVYREKAGTSPG